MKIHTTNYSDTFIEVAEDCPANVGEIPPAKKDEKSVANIQFEMISQNPYKFTSDDILFHCFATKKGLTNNELEAQREIFFSKGQPCFRSSPLTKRYGWGIHNNTEGKIALYAVGSMEYQKFKADKNLKIVKAMRSKKA
ncbi:MAG: hypothetical protein H0U39_03475 [Segetibacter sp.]|nr:hypothetical protein [Segetibacter sp.]